MGVSIIGTIREHYSVQNRTLMPAPTRSFGIGVQGSGSKPKTRNLKAVDVESPVQCESRRSSALCFFELRTFFGPTHVKDASG